MIKFIIFITLLSSVSCTTKKKLIQLGKYEEFDLPITNNGGHIKISINDRSEIAIYQLGIDSISVYSEKGVLLKKVDLPTGIVNDIYFHNEKLIIRKVFFYYRYDFFSNNWDTIRREHVIARNFIPFNIYDKILNCNFKIPLSIQESKNRIEGNYFLFNENNFYQIFDNYLIKIDLEDCYLTGDNYFFESISLKNSVVEGFWEDKKIIFISNNINKLYCYSMGDNTPIFELKNNGDINQLPFHVNLKKRYIISMKWKEEQKLAVVKWQIN